MKAFLFSIAAMCCAIATPAHAILVDNFNDGSGSVSVGAAGSGSDSSACVGCIGGNRDVDVPGGIAVSGAGSLTLAANPGSSGVLTFSLDALTSGSGFLTWDAAGAGLGSEDLTDAGASTFFTFDIVSIDQGDVDLIVTATEGAGGGGDTASLTVLNAGVGTVQFTFASMSTTGDGVDFTDIESITLEIQGEDGSDLVLDQFFTSGEVENNGTPEPTSILLAICGLLGLTIARRRRRRA